MSADTLLIQAQAEGLTVSLEAGAVALYGPPEVRSRWAPLLRPHKAELVEVLSPRHRWTLTYPDKEPETLTVSPPESKTQVEARYPAAQVEPWTPVPPTAALSDADDANVRAYLLAIGEDDPRAVAEVLAACWEDANARAHWVSRATACLYDDDRRTCRQCRNLAGAYCRGASRGELIATARQYHPPADQPRRCEGFAPMAGDSDQRPGAEHWPSLLTPNLGRPQFTT